MVLGSANIMVMEKRVEKKRNITFIKVEIGDNLYKLLYSMSTSNEIRHALTSIFESVAKSNQEQWKKK